LIPFFASLDTMAVDTGNDPHTTPTTQPRRRRALVVGIDYLDNEAWSDVSGQNDAQNVREFLIGDLWRHSILSWHL
jgi:hypothetical protein